MYCLINVEGAIVSVHLMVHITSIPLINVVQSLLTGVDYTNQGLRSFQFNWERVLIYSII